MKNNLIGTLKEILKKTPLLGQFIRAHLYRALRYRYGLLRHRLSLRFSSRPPQEAFTRFYRTPHQFAALLDPVLEFLKPSQLGRPLHIVVLACSTGAEPYSVASALVNERPDIDFEMIAGDINEELVAKCKQGVYSAEEIFSNELITESFVAQTFEKVTAGDTDPKYKIRAKVSERVTFSVIDALDPKLAEVTGKADILFLQNVLFNLPPNISTRMFINSLTLLRDRTVIFLDGMDVHQRTKMTANYGLSPLEYEIEATHKEVWRIRKNGWPGLYWGIEPYWPDRKDTLTRYATIYLYAPGYLN